MHNQYDLTWSPDGTHLLVSTDGGPLWLYDASNFDAPPRMLLEHAAGEARYSRDGSRLLLSALGEVQVWETQPYRKKHSLSFNESDLFGYMLLSSESRYAGILGCESGRTPFEGTAYIVVWEVESGDLRIAIETERVYGYDFSPAGDQIAYVTNMGVIHIWDIASARELDQWDSGTGLDLDNSMFGWYEAGIAVWFRILNWYASYAGEDIGKYNVCLWNPERDIRQNSMLDEADAYTMLGIEQADNLRLDINLLDDIGMRVFHSADDIEEIEAVPMYIRVWNPVSKLEVFRKEIDEYGYNGVDLSSDRQILAIVEAEDSFNLYSIPDGEMIRTVKIPAAE